MLYNVVSVSAVQRCEPALRVHIPPPTWTRLPTPHLAPLGHHRRTQWDYFSQLECKLLAMDLSFLPTEIQQTSPSTRSQITTDKGNR